MKRLVLLGGGHAHVHVLDALARAPLPDTEVTLVSPYPQQIYSGMLPGWIAGHYPLDACAVALPPLAARAGCTLRQTRAIALEMALSKDERFRNVGALEAPLWTLKSQI